MAALSHPSQANQAASMLRLIEAKKELKGAEHVDVAAAYHELAEVFLKQVGCTLHGMV